jgi:hypothetical protein
MLDALFNKGLRAEVTEGIDLEYGITLSGKRVTVGSGPTDDLRLGAADIVPGHLIFERRADGKGWEYFTSDSGRTQVDRGNPRTGTVRPGMWFRLGSETRLELSRTALPAETVTNGETDGPKTIPLTIALPAMGIMVIGALFLVTALGDRGAGDLSLQTAGWVAGSSTLEDAVDACLQTTLTPARAIAESDPASPFWRSVTFRDTDPARAEVARAELIGSIREALASAHLLSRENKNIEASKALRRLEYVLPVGSADCPILTASRFDLAVFELRGSR